MKEKLQDIVFSSLSSVEHPTEALPTGAPATADGFAFSLPSDGLNQYKLDVWCLFLLIIKSPIVNSYCFTTMTCNTQLNLFVNTLALSFINMHISSITIHGITLIFTCNSSMTDKQKSWVSYGKSDYPKYSLLGFIQSYTFIRFLKSQACTNIVIHFDYNHQLSIIANETTVNKNRYWVIAWQGKPLCFFHAILRVLNKNIF